MQPHALNEMSASGLTREVLILDGEGGLPLSTGSVPSPDVPARSKPSGIAQLNGIKEEVTATGQGASTESSPPPPPPPARTHFRNEGIANLAAALHRRASQARKVEERAEDELDDRRPAESPWLIRRVSSRACRVSKVSGVAEHWRWHGAGRSVWPIMHHAASTRLRSSRHACPLPGPMPRVSPPPPPPPPTYPCARGCPPTQPIHPAYSLHPSP